VSRQWGLWLAAATGVAVVLSSAAASDASAVSETTSVETIPLDLQGPRPIAMLTIGNSPAVPVVFDTGASGPVLDVGYARSLNLPNLGTALVGSPAGGTPVEGFQTKIAKGRLGNAAIAEVTVVAVPVPLPRAKGVFGPSVFAGKLVDIDLTGSVVRITPKTRQYIPKAAAVPYSDGPRGLPAMTVEVNGARYDAHIDTGSNGALLFPKRMESQLPLEAPAHPIAKARLPSGEEVDVLGGRIKGTVRVGPLVLENPEVAFIDGLQRVNVGMKILRGLRIILDPAEQRGWIIS
jgi:hypothetical protein